MISILNLMLMLSFFIKINSTFIYYKCDFLCQKRINSIIKSKIVSEKIYKFSDNIIQFSDSIIDFSKFDFHFSNIITGKDIFIIYIQEKINSIKKLISHEKKTINDLNKRIIEFDLEIANNEDDINKKLDDNIEILLCYLNSKNFLLNELYKKLNDYQYHLNDVIFPMRNL